MCSFPFFFLWGSSDFTSNMVAWRAPFASALRSASLTARGLFAPPPLAFAMMGGAALAVDGHSMYTSASSPPPSPVKQRNIFEPEEGEDESVAPQAAADDPNRHVIDDNDPLMVASESLVRDFLSECDARQLKKDFESNQ